VPTGNLGITILKILLKDLKNSFVKKLIEFAKKWEKEVVGLFY